MSMRYPLCFIFLSLACVSDTVGSSGEPSGSSGTATSSGATGSSGGAGAGVLGVKIGGTGRGVVTAEPSGIDCGTICSQSYPAGTVVKLTAKPINAARFVGWLGAVGCASDPTCNVTVPEGPLEVTARFDAAPTTWDPIFNSSQTLTYSENNTVVETSTTLGGDRQNVRTTVGKDAGKYYWEIRLFWGISGWS
jgi:Divergent InlB B-repeat domain